MQVSSSISKGGNSSPMDPQKAKRKDEIISKGDQEEMQIKQAFFDVPTNKHREFNEEDLEKEDEYDNNEDFEKNIQNSDAKQEEQNKSKYSNRPKAKLTKEGVDLAGNFPY